jgi:hypothetical protein
VTDPVTRVELRLDRDLPPGPRPHGGHLLRALAEAALTVDHPHPLALSAHFLTPPDSAAATVLVERLRTGRRAAVSRTELVQGGTVQVSALLTAGRLDPAVEPRFGRHDPPVLPPPETCVVLPARLPDGTHVGFREVIDIRLDPATSDWDPDAPTQEGEVRGWLRRSDGEPAGVLDLLPFTDVLPPTTWSFGLPGWAPTVELTFLLRALPAPGWIRARSRATLLQDGWLDQDCWLWDSRGRLVAQARQLKSYREP